MCPAPVTANAPVAEVEGQRYEPEPAAAEAAEATAGVRVLTRGERVVAQRRERAAREAERKRVEEDSSDEDSSEGDAHVVCWSAAELGTFDIILASDCVYEPLYGESWRALVSVVCEAPVVSSFCAIVCFGGRLRN